MAVMVVVSYLTHEPDYKQIRGLTYGTETEENKKSTQASWGWREVVTSGVVLAVILGGYLYFQG